MTRDRKPRGRRRLLRIAACVGACALSVGSAGAAGQGAPERPSELASVEALGLESVRTGVTAYYSPGFRARAESLGQLLGGALRFFADSLGVDPDLRLAVLGPADWHRVSGHPYGLPHVRTRGDVSMAVLPADGSGAVHAVYQSMGPELSAPLRHRLEALGSGWDDAARRMVDLIGLHEVGHTVAGAYGARAPRKWLDEVIASYLAYAFLSARRPEGAAVWDLMVDASLELQRPGYHTLADFERLYTRVGVDDYVWYQSMFALRARALVREHGLGFLAALEGPADAGRDEPADGAVPDRLERLSPGFRAWSRAFQARDDPAAETERRRAGATAEIVFREDFDGPRLDRSRWNVVGTDFWVNNEQQAYVDSAAVLRIVHGDSAAGAGGGALLIQAHPRPGLVTERGTFDFVSGRVNTRGKVEFTYGTAAARMKLPPGQGLWPAFWILGTGDWPDTGEIDVMEYVGETGWISHALHGPGYSGDTPLVEEYTFPPGEDATGWHVYAVDWSPDSLVFRVDGEATYRVGREDVEPYGRWAFDNPKFLILNLALGGVYPQNVNGVEAPYPGLPAATVEQIADGEAIVLVDWVRVMRSTGPR